MADITVVGSVGPAPRIVREDAAIHTLQPEGGQLDAEIYVAWLEDALEFRGFFLVAYNAYHWGEEFL